MVDNRKRYETKCPSCKNKIYVCKSIGMDIELTNQGFGMSCHCNSYLKLIFDSSEDTMKAVLYENNVNISK